MQNDLQDQQKLKSQKDEVIRHLEAKCGQMQIQHSRQMELLTEQFDEFKKQSFVSVLGWITV